MRARLMFAVAFALAACGPPRAAQFVGQDGSPDWWAIDCRGDEAACLRQASDACAGSYEAHEVRAGGSTGAAERVSFVVHDSAPSTPPSGVTLAGKTLVVKCAAATVPPRAVAGPECTLSQPRLDHCDVAAGDTFATGRTYLSASVIASAAPAAPSDGLTPEAALAELRTIADGLDGEVAAVAQPILAVDAVVKALSDFPRTYRVKPAVVKSLAKASLAGRAVTLPRELRPEIAEELSTLLAKVKATDAALTATPDRASALLEKIATRHARVKVVASRAQEPFDAKLKAATLSSADKASAEASIGEIQELQLDARKKLDATRTRVTELSAQIMQALAKLGDATS